MITTLFCDLDGTLIDSRRDIVEAFQHALHLVTCETLPTEHAIAQHIGKPLAQMVHDLGYRLSKQQQSIFLDSYRQYYSQHGVRYTRPYPGVTETLQMLSARTLAIVTTKLQGQAEIILEQLNLAAFFQHVQGGTQGLRLKPAPDTILAALEVLQCHADHTLMVGDTTADMHAGKAAGVQTCAVTYGFGNEDELRGCQPDYCITSFCDLPAIVRGA